MEQTGKVWLAGAGPGDAGLLTVKAKELIQEADVIVYDALVSTEILCQIPSEKETIYVGKRSGHHCVCQEEINQILRKEAQKGKRVLRLKGGDPFVFGRGGEELELLSAYGIPFEVVPGVTSAAAVPAYAGIPVTHREYTSSFHVIAGHPRKDGASRIDFSALAAFNGTLVFLMGISSMKYICEGLIGAGMRKDMPAAVLERGTTSAQRRIVSDVAHLPEEAQRANIGTPAIILVGEVCALAEAFHWAEDRPLGGRQFLITRPKQNSSRLAGALRRLGAQVLELPAIRTEAISPNTVLKEALETFGKNCAEAWLVFTSPIGVDIFFEQLMQQKVDVRTLILREAKLKLAAIGSATEKALRQHGFFADVVPGTFNAGELGRALARTAAPESEVVIVRAAEGSEDLIPPLREAGLPVRDVPLYHTKYELHEHIRGKVAEALACGEVDAVTFTSASTVRGFVQGMGLADYSGIRAVCIGRQTAEEAGKYGMQVRIAEQASMDSMVERILEEFGNGSCERKR